MLIVAWESWKRCFKKLAKKPRLQERIKNRRKDDDHKLSRNLVEKNKIVVFSKDNIKGIAKSYGKSVAEVGHYSANAILQMHCKR
jgi:transposase